MTYKDLYVFRTVADCGNIREAARRLNTKPSTVSRKMSSLESDTGSKLMNRDCQPITLTEDGLYLVNMIDDGLSTTQKLRSFREKRQSCQLNIGYAFPVSWDMLSYKLYKLKQTNPHVNAMVRSADKIRIRNLLIEGQLDLAILPDKLFFRNYRIIEEINNYEWGFAAPCGVPLSDRDYLIPEDIEGVPLLIPFEINCAAAIRKWYGDDIRMNISCTYNCQELLINMISSGFGYGFAPRLVKRKLERFNITYYMLSPKLETNLYVYCKWQNDASEILQKFLNI